ncbi:MAG: hypothetical protein HY269_09975 [Deltaproteobacteria bacterium]|nr:hypothetical protein [Deltaproteobacteria bacterium]
MAAALLAGAAGLAGCNDDEAQKAFRGAAESALQSGAQSIASGLIDGTFAVFDIGANAASSSSSTDPNAGG